MSIIIILSGLRNEPKAMVRPHCLCAYNKATTHKMEWRDT